MPKTWSRTRWQKPSPDLTPSGRTATSAPGCTESWSTPTSAIGGADFGSARDGERCAFGYGNAVGGRPSAEKHWRPRRHHRNARPARAVPPHGLLRGCPRTPVQGNRRGDEHADRNGGVPPTSRPAPTTQAAHRG